MILAAFTAALLTLTGTPPEYPACTPTLYGWSCPTDTDDTVDQDPARDHDTWTEPPPPPAPDTECRWNGRGTNPC